MLEALGCRVNVASECLEALDSVSHTEYGLILMDCHMPAMDGFAAAGEIRRLEREEDVALGRRRSEQSPLEGELTHATRRALAQRGSDLVRGATELSRLAR